MTPAALPLVTPGTANAEQAALLARTPPINLFGLLAHAAPLASRVAGLGAAVMGGECDPVLRELVALRVAARLGAPYVEGQHRRVAERIGLDLDVVDAATDIAAHIPQTPHGDILQLADAVAGVQTLDRGLAARLEAAHGASGLVTLAVVAGYFAMLSGVTRAFDLPLEAPPQA